MRGWERVTLTDLAHRDAARVAAKAPPSRTHKFLAEPCIVTADGTLFTTTDIHTAEFATGHPLIGTGTLQDRAARSGIAGTWFASTKEGTRYLQLRMLERTGAITDLRCQVEYDLLVVSKVDGTAHTVAKWTCDFQYHRGVELLVEDVKSVATRKLPTYRLKRKMFEAIYGLRILET